MKTTKNTLRILVVSVGLLIAAGCSATSDVIISQAETVTTQDATSQDTTSQDTTEQQATSQPAAQAEAASDDSAEREEVVADTSNEREEVVADTSDERADAVADDSDEAPEVPEPTPTVAAEPLLTNAGAIVSLTPVSYTHLTLPTICSV